RGHQRRRPRRPAPAHHRPGPGDPGGGWRQAVAPAPPPGAVEPAPGRAHLPGAAHPGQPRAGQPRTAAARPAWPPEARGAGGRHQLPLRRGPARQGGVPRRAAPGRVLRRLRRARARRRRRAPGQPALALGQAALGAARRAARPVLTVAAWPSRMRGCTSLPPIPSPTEECCSMLRRLALIALVVFACALPAQAAGLTGKYVEARTCDIWTGPCYANAEVNLSGKNAVLAWKVEKGALDGTRLDGLGVVAVIAASDTLGQEQTGKSTAVLLVDKRATAAQKAALVKLARKQGGALVENVVSVLASKVDLEICPGKEGGCAKLDAGTAKIETRCLTPQHDKICGNESAYSPPLSKGVKVNPALSLEHSYPGKGARETWSDAGRR